MPSYALKPQFEANSSPDEAKMLTGTAVLSGGTLTVTDANIKAGALAWITRQVDGGGLGSYKAVITASTLVITSSSGTDTSTVNWMVVNQ